MVPTIPTPKENDGMRFQRALPVIGCGSLSILALVIGGCSSKSSNNTDSGVDSGPVDAPMDHTTTPDVPKDTGVDKGQGRHGRHLQAADRRARHQRVDLHRHRADGAADFRLFEPAATRRSACSARTRSSAAPTSSRRDRPQHGGLQRHELAHLRARSSATTTLSAFTGTAPPPPAVAARWTCRSGRASRSPSRATSAPTMRSDSRWAAPTTIRRPRTPPAAPA